uniref:Tumor necrosis factor alpha-induced protein 8-like protein n=1 Tax=Strigamia maritima TaxID=126957 RepID=T1JFQ3_STRMM
MGMRAQKKILGRMSNRSMAKVFIDDTTGNLLDNLHRVVRLRSESKKEAEKVIKNVIKIVVKIGILYRNDQFNKEELLLVERFKRKFHSTAMTVVSFYEVDYSYDRNFLVQSLNECCAMLTQLVRPHLTDKSIARIDHVFRFFTDNELLEKLFRKDGEYRRLMSKIVADMHKLMEDGGL